MLRVRSLLWAQVRSLVRELGSCKQSECRKQTNKQNQERLKTGAAAAGLRRGLREEGTGGAAPVKSERGFC